MGPLMDGLEVEVNEGHVFIRQRHADVTVSIRVSGEQATVMSGWLKEAATEAGKQNDAK
jgi:hypothetical protein